MLIKNGGVDIDYKQRCDILFYSAEYPIDNNAEVSVPRPNDTGSVQPLKTTSITLFPTNGLSSCIVHCFMNERFQVHLRHLQKMPVHTNGKLVNNPKVLNPYAFLLPVQCTPLGVRLIVHSLVFPFNHATANPFTVLCSYSCNGHLLI